MKEYIALGGPDLAECVEKGLRYTALTGIIGGEMDLCSLNSLAAAFLGEGIMEIASMAHWADWAMREFRGDPNLERIIEACGTREFAPGGKWADSCMYVTDESDRSTVDDSKDTGALDQHVAVLDVRA
jgi:hypothetical protein